MCALQERCLSIEEIDEIYFPPGARARREVRLFCRSCSSTWRNLNIELSVSRTVECTTITRYTQPGARGAGARPAAATRQRPRHDPRGTTAGTRSQRTDAHGSTMVICIYRIQTYTLAPARRGGGRVMGRVPRPIGVGRRTAAHTGYILVLSSFVVLRVQPHCSLGYNPTFTSYVSGARTLLKTMLAPPAHRPVRSSPLAITSAGTGSNEQHFRQRL